MAKNPNQSKSIIFCENTNSQILTLTPTPNSESFPQAGKKLSFAKAHLLQRYEMYKIDFLIFFHLGVEKTST